METISIRSKNPLRLEPLEEILSRDWPIEASDNALVVHGTKGRCYLYPSPESSAHEVFELFLDYSDLDFAKRVLEKIANDSAITVDNDFGTILAGDQFVARCKSEGGWDWRK